MSSQTPCENLDGDCAAYVVLVTMFLMFFLIVIVFVVCYPTCAVYRAPFCSSFRESVDGCVSAWWIFVCERCRPPSNKIVDAVEVV